MMPLRRWMPSAAAGAALAGGLLVIARPCAAHVPELRGRLIDLVGQSEQIVIGTVEQVRAVDARTNETRVRVEQWLVGETKDTRLTFRSRPRFAAGQRFVFFLQGQGADLECVQPSGTVFAAAPPDDAAYRDAVGAIRRAASASESERPALLRAALIPALSADAPALRYQALLELGALAHHGLSAADRRALERLIADPTSDAALRPIVITILQRDAASPLESAAR